MLYPRVGAGLFSSLDLLGNPIWPQFLLVENCEYPYPGYTRPSHTICGEYRMSVMLNQEIKLWIFQPYITVETLYIGGTTFWSDVFPSRINCHVIPIFFLIALFLTQPFQVTGDSHFQHLLSKAFVCPSSCCIGQSKYNLNCSSLGNSLMSPYLIYPNPGGY